MVGTALYVSPEVQGSTKSAYNQVKKKLWGEKERSREMKITALGIQLPAEIAGNIHLLCQFSSVTQSCPTLCDPMDCSTPAFPVHLQLPELAQTHVHWVSDAIQPSYPLLSPSSPAFSLSQYQGLFQWVRSAYQVARVLEFQLQHQSFQWIFGTDFLQDWLIWSPWSPSLCHVCIEWLFQVGHVMPKDSDWSWHSRCRGAYSPSVHLKKIWTNVPGTTGNKAVN